MIDSVSHRAQKNSLFRDLRRQISSDLGQVDLGASSGSAQHPTGLRRFKAAHAKMVSCSAPNLRVPDIDATKDARLGPLRIQAEVEAFAIQDDKGKLGSTRRDEAFGYREFAERGLNFCLKASQYAKHRLNERDGKLEAPHFKRDSEVEEISLRELSAAATPASVTYFGDDDFLFAKVDQLVLGSAQQPGSLSQRPGSHKMIVNVYHGAVL